MAEFALVSFLILMIIQQSCRVATIIQTKYCPLFEKEWTEKKEEIKCKDGEAYFCSLAEDNTFISGCLPPYPIPANSSGCPFVVKSNKLIPHEDKFTPCNENLKGCPPSVHLKYTISQLYKYPQCLKLPSERMTSIIAPVEYETGYSTNSTTSAYDGDKREIHINAVVAIAFGLLTVTVIAVVAVVGFVIRTKRVFERSLRDIRLNVNGSDENNESVQEVMSGCPRHESNNGMNEDIFKEKDSDKITKLPELSMKTIESSFFDLCQRNAEDAAAENLERDLKEEYENIKGGCKSRITAEEIREIICIWEKKHGKVPFRTVVEKLLSLLNKNVV